MVKAFWMRLWIRTWLDARGAGGQAAIGGLDDFAEFDFQN